MDTYTTSRNKILGPWGNRNGVKCVILCAGRGLRISHEEKPKVMIEVEGKPILSYIVNYWRKYTEEFIFVVGYKKDQVIEFVQRLPINCYFVEQRELKGIADALLYVESLVSDQFIVALGDCICQGEFTFPPGMEQGVGVWGTDNLEDIKRSYSVEIRDNLIRQVEEKPKRVANNLCGMGFYFFHRTVFDFIKRTEPSKLRHEKEITDVIQNMINGGEKIAPVFFNGDYLNITYPRDLQKARELLMKAEHGKKQAEVK